MSKRKKYTTAFKAKVVLELLREEKPLAQVAGQYEVHPTQLRKWKQVAVEHLPSLFTDSQQDQARQQAEHERQLEQLYAEIGRLTTQLAWLKKKAGIEQLPG
jgi:transposase